MELETILTIISAILGVIAMVAGGFWAKAKGKVGAIKNLSKEVFELVSTAVNAIEDDKITKDEVNAIKKEAEEVKAAFHALIGK